MRPRGKQDLHLVVIALVLAGITYGYLNHAMRKSGGVDPSYRLIKLTAKTVPVKVRFASSPPEGFRLMLERVSVTPERVTVIGPEALLEETSSAETAILDVSQTRRKTLKVIPLESVAGIPLAGEPYIVEVLVPIEEIEAAP